jgi:hypothetical protein
MKPQEAASRIEAATSGERRRGRVGPDCKSGALKLSGFESHLPHDNNSRPSPADGPAGHDEGRRRDSKLGEMPQRAVPPKRPRCTEVDRKGGSGHRATAPRAGRDADAGLAAALSPQPFPRRPGRNQRSRDSGLYASSRSRCASGSCFSFFSVLFSIWRIRSRVTPNARPTSSRVSGSCPRNP